MDKIEEGTKELIGRIPFGINPEDKIFLESMYSGSLISGNFLHMFGVDSTIEDIWNSSRWIFFINS